MQKLSLGLGACTCIAALSSAPLAAAPIYSDPQAAAAEAQAEALQATAPRPQAAGSEARQPTPDEVLRNGIAKLREFLSADGPRDAASIRGFLVDHLAGSFDFDAMARAAAGPMRQSLDEDQQARFTERLSALFLSALARNLGSQAHPLPEVELGLPRLGRMPNHVRVPGRVLPARGYPIPIEFRFHLVDGTWKVFDVSVNGASAAAFYRGYFGRLARQQGIGALLD